MKAAIAHGKRPSVLVLGKGSTKKPKTVKQLLRALHDETVYDRTDVVLGKAYQRFLNELCGQCGYPKYLCHNDDNRIQFRLARDECAATAMAENEQVSITKRYEKNPHLAPKGVRIYAEPYLTEDAVEEGLELSDFRRPYLLDRARALGLVDEEEYKQARATMPVSGN